MDGFQNEVEAAVAHLQGLSDQPVKLTKVSKAVKDEAGDVYLRLVLCKEDACVTESVRVHPNGPHPAKVQRVDALPGDENHSPNAPPQPTTPSPEGKQGFVLYCIHQCPFCDRAKALLTEQSIAFEVVDCDAVAGGKSQAANDLAPATGNYRQYPMVFQDGKFLGGFTQLRASLDAQAKQHVFALDEDF